MALRRKKQIEAPGEDSDLETRDAPGAPADARLRLLSIGWFSLASVAALYLATMWLFPPAELGSPWTPETGGIASYDSAAVTKSARLTVAPAIRSDGRVLTLKDLTEELHGLKATVTDLRHRNDALTREVGALSEALLNATGSIAKPGTAKRRRVPNGVSTVMRDMPEDGFGDDALSAASPIPIASASAPSRTLFAVELSKAKSVKSLKAAWKQLGSRHGQLLAGLKARRVESEGAQWRLVAGPFSNAADAARLCARLRAAKTECSETVFDGVSL